MNTLLPSSLLAITNLHASLTEPTKPILHGLNLTVQGGEVHAIMGPNGAGKSTLGYVLAGREGYEVTSGSAHLHSTDLLALEPHARAHAGLFLAFQYPVELPGVNVAQFLKATLNSHHAARGEPELKTPDFLKLVRTEMAALEMPETILQRHVNTGFSGGEKKRFEILQMALLQPTLAVLDETDSGLDIDALKIVANGVNRLRSPNRGFVVITHYQRLLDYLTPTHVHILAGGTIVRSGGPELAHALEAQGYEKLLASPQ
jgi:Fe-S cluster assembly ATP-binding protein